MIDGIAGRTAPTVEGTLARLERFAPNMGWLYTENYLVYRGTLWLQFSSEDRRMWWVRVEDSEEVTMEWNLGGVPDLV